MGAGAAAAEAERTEPTVPLMAAAATFWKTEPGMGLATVLAPGSGLATGLC